MQSIFFLFSSPRDFFDEKKKQFQTIILPSSVGKDQLEQWGQSGEDKRRSVTYFTLNNVILVYINELKELSIFNLFYVNFYFYFRQLQFDFTSLCLIGSRAVDFFCESKRFCSVKFIII